MQPVMLEPVIALLVVVTVVGVAGFAGLAYLMHLSLKTQAALLAKAAELTEVSRDQATQAAAASKLLQETLTTVATEQARLHEVGLAHITQVLENLGAVQGSFTHLTDTLKDLDNLERISAQVGEMGRGVTEVSGKLSSQVETSGKVLSELTAVVTTWSRERAPLERAHGQLAAAVQEALSYEKNERSELRKLLAALAVGRAAAEGGQRAGR